MEKICPCGKVIFVKPWLVKRKKYCSKLCQNKYHTRPSGLTYKLVKENPTSFKKGQVPWNRGLPEEKSPFWKGDKVGYWGIHSWAEKHLGKPKLCEMCGTTSAKKFEWSNKSGNYKRNVSDWQRLCVTCHFNYDKQKFGTRKNFKRSKKMSD